MAVERTQRSRHEQRTWPVAVSAWRRVLVRLIALALYCGSSPAVGQEAVRPGARGEAIEIEASIIVIDLDAVNDATQSFDANVYVLLSWTDPGIRQDASRSALASQLWLPDVALGNQQVAWTVLKESVHVGAEGSVEMRRGIWGSFSQPLDLRRFPFDRQTLSVILLADADVEELHFAPDPDRPSGISGALSVPDWTVTGVTTSSDPFIVSEGIAPVPAFRLKVSIQRRPLYYVYTMILPLFAVVGMAYAVFWIDPENFGIQIAVASTSMLTVVSYRIAAVQILPRTAYFTDLDQFIAGSTVLVFLALVSTVLTGIIYRRGDAGRARRIDGYGRYAFPAAFLALTGLAFT
jgi:hypothetical protein